MVTLLLPSFLRLQRRIQLHQLHLRLKAVLQDEKLQLNCLMSQPTVSFSQQTQRHCQRDVRTVPFSHCVAFHKANFLLLVLFCFFLPPNNTYHPRFVTEIVDRVQRVNTWQAGVLQPDHHVPVVSVLVHAEGVLSDQHKVRLEGPGAQDVRHVFNCRVSQQ